MKSIPDKFFFTKGLLLIPTMLFLLFNNEINTFCQIDSRKKISTVVIDAGHGGKDPGAHGSISLEKNITLHIALKLGSLIEKNLPDVKVIYTRKTDVFIPLYERAEIANKNHADLFISIHVNSSPNQKPDGTETYAMGLAKTKENLEVAEKENAVILNEDNYASKYDGYDPKSSESFIIFTLLQNTYMEQSLNFATYVQNQFKDKAQREDRGVKQAGFLVLWKTAMPSVLVETGFISNPEEEKFLNSDRGVDLIASAIYRAFKNYKRDIENHSVYVNRSTQDSSVIQGPPQDNDSLPGPGAQALAADSVPATDSIEFLVQIISSKKNIPFKNKCFKGYKDIEEIKTADCFKYAVGRNKSYEETLTYCKSVKGSFPDAFIIALRNGKIIPVKEALKEIKD